MKKTIYSSKKVAVILFGFILLFGSGSAAYANMRAYAEQDSMTFLPVIMNGQSVPSDAQDIFIVGDSTVRAHTVSWSNRECGDDDPTDTLRGWGDDVSLYLADPSREFNKARQGASAETYHDAPPGGQLDELYREIAENPLPLTRYWDSTSGMMAASDGGFLLIQFGSSNETQFYYGYWVDGHWTGGRYSNETDANRVAWTKIDFKNAIGFYVDQARSMGIVPILVTTPVGRTKNADGTHRDDRGVFPGYVREVAAEKNVQLLDLHAKTLQEFGKYADETLQVEFGNCIGNPGTANERMDRIHYEPQGARKLAGWIKELACELPDHALCEQFSTTNDRVIPTITLNGGYWVTLRAGEAFVDAGATAVDDTGANLTNAIVVNGSVNSNAAGNYTITYDVTDASGNDAIQVTRYVEVIPNVFAHEDAEDSDIAGWSRYAGSGVAHNIIDYERGSRVISLIGPDGTNGGFSLGDDWHETERHVLSWSMNYSEEFTFFIRAETTNGFRYFYYQPTDNGNEITHGGVRYRFSLGSAAMDGNWHTFTRDLQADLASLDPGNEIEFIYGIAVRGSGRIDDIKVMLATDSVGDEIPPTVTRNGAASVIVPLNSTYTDAGATANDNADGDITNRITVNNPVNTAVAASYEVTYGVHDSSGNGAFTTRVVEVVDGMAKHEDAEDGNITGWSRYWVAANSAVSNVADNGGRAIAFVGTDGVGNGYKFDLTPEVSGGFVTSWDMKYAVPFKFMVKVRTTTHDPLYIYYAPDDLDRGYELSNGNHYIHNALGSDMLDGTWHTFSRDLEADLKRVLPDEEIEAILGFRMRGSNGRIDNIITATRGGYATFAYDGHTYEIVKNALSWQAASDAALAGGGYLPHIGSIAENHEIYSRLNRYISEAEYGSTSSANGGGATYVWIGANDRGSEGMWRWENNNAHFWTGSTNGNAEGGLFTNWGKDVNRVQHEPDNSGNNQDAGAIALTEWPHNSGSLGQTSQWNDLIDTGALYYIIEHD